MVTTFGHTSIVAVVASTLLVAVVHVLAQQPLPGVGGMQNFPAGFGQGGVFGQSGSSGQGGSFGGGSRQDPQMRYFVNRKNLYPYGPGTRDVLLQDRESQTGRLVDLLIYFPYYGGRYNYSIIAVHGYVAFGNVMDNGIDLMIGENVLNWPQFPDPPIMAIYGCLQKPIVNAPREHKGVRYRLVFRREVFANLPINKRNQFSQRATLNYLDDQGDEFLDMVWRDLNDGMVGAGNFRPDAALVVTWENVTFYQASPEDELSGKVATYQLVFMTDRSAQLSYIIINYHTLGYGGADIRGGQKRGRCKTELVGGNKTGSVLIDPVYSKTPDQLATVSSVPHQAGGRYLFRVDDVVRKGGCSNLTVGTYRLTIYPDIVNSMGDSTVTLNGLCLKPGVDQPVLYFSENRPSWCIVKNAAIAECKMQQYYQWSVKHVFFRVNENRVYIGTIYYVPNGLDPYELNLGSMDLWYTKKPPIKRDISWFPGNFTDSNFRRVSNLELSLWGYKEWRDERYMKFIPTLTKLAIINQLSNNQDPRVLQQTYTLMSNQMFPNNWLVPGEEAMSYRFGFLKLASIDPQHNMGEGNAIWSKPVPLHWFYKDLHLESYSTDKCIEWFEEDGQQWNFIRDTETNSSCPCRLEQANIDLGRYMPHPRCSQRFRTLSCETFIGAKECFISTNNVEGNYVTHYGQVCCYDRDGFLMQTTYQTVVQVPEYPYNPGFPQRAYEFGTYPFTKQFELPTLSNYYHDVLPYFFCCKWSINHCQFFYWRRPGSGCQEYYAPAVGTVMGAGHFVTFDGARYTFNDPGTYVLVHKPESYTYPLNRFSSMKSPKVLIELRLERYPNRMVDFSSRLTNQYELVQPLNASVITGVALQEGNPEESDRVLVILRKDCRRFRYRTNIFVNDELVYFDTMKIQRFRGVTIYVNGWMEGQSEVYVVLEQSRIGVRIRESYGMEIRRRMIFEESMGLLDVLVSLPPEYKLNPQPGDMGMSYDLSIAGLLGTYTNNSKDEFLLPDRKSFAQQGDLEISGDSAAKFANSWKVDNHQFEDLFTLIDLQHSVWPESELIGPVYTAAPEILKEFPYYPQYRMNMEELYQRCLAVPMSSDMCLNLQEMNEIETTCLNMFVCRYDFLLLKQKILGQEIRKFYEVYLENRKSGMRNYTSCGAINIEYPDYLLINPPTGKLYLEGNEIQFECYPTHWIKGTDHYTCSSGQWNKGWQPWCRSKQLEITLKILSIIFGILCCLAALIAIFLCCWVVKRNRRDRSKGQTYKTGEPLDKAEDRRNGERAMLYQPEKQRPIENDYVRAINSNGGNRKVEIFTNSNHSSPSQNEIHYSTPPLGIKTSV